MTTRTQEGEAEGAGPRTHPRRRGSRLALGVPASPRRAPDQTRDETVVPAPAATRPRRPPREGREPGGRSVRSGEEGAVASTASGPRSSPCRRSAAPTRKCGHRRPRPEPLSTHVPSRPRPEIRRRAPPAGGAARTHESRHCGPAGGDLGLRLAEGTPPRCGLEGGGSGSPVALRETPSLVPVLEPPSPNPRSSQFPRWVGRVVTGSCLWMGYVYTGRQNLKRVRH